MPCVPYSRWVGMYLLRSFFRHSKLSLCYEPSAKGIKPPVAVLSPFHSWWLSSSVLFFLCVGTIRTIQRIPTTYRPSSAPARRWPHVKPPEAHTLRVCKRELCQPLIYFCHYYLPPSISLRSGSEGKRTKLQLGELRLMGPAPRT